MSSRARSSARERPEFALERRELAIEVVDDREQRRERVAPDLRDPALGQLGERAGLAQRGQVAPQAPLGQ
jgi:hypothetical protein